MNSFLSIAANPVPLPALQSRPGANAGQGDMEKLRRSFQELEGFLLSQLLAPMFSELEPAAPFGGGFGEDMWRAFQVEQYGLALAKSGGIGLADTMVRGILEAQEAQSEAAL